jgi:hypothetical protein
MSYATVGYTPGSGENVAIDTIAGAAFQRLKVSYGAEGSATDVDTTNRFPVDVPDGLAVSGSVTSAAVLFTQDMLGYESITVHVISAGSGCTTTYETSDDNSTWVLTSGLISTALGNSGAATATGTAVMMCFPRRGRYFRARVSVYGSGTVSVVGTVSKMPMVPFLLGVTLNQPVIGPAAHDAAIASAPIRIGGRALNANYTAVATGDVADLVTTLVGALISKPYAIPEQDWSYAAAASGIVNTTTAVTFKTADATHRNYITAIQIMAEALGTATELAIRDGAGGTVLWRIKIGTGGLTNGLSVVFPNPLRGTAATLLEVVTLTASTTGAVYFNAQGYVAP